MLHCHASSRRVSNAGCLLILSLHIIPGLSRLINPHLAPTLDAFRRAPQPAGSGRATGRSADGGAQAPPLSTYAARQAGATPLGGRGDRSVSGISSFAFQVQSSFRAVSLWATLGWLASYVLLLADSADRGGQYCSSVGW